jgi:hypothetical protein
MELWPGARLLALGKHEVFRHHDDTPAHKYEFVIKFFDGPCLIELSARDSFDERLAEFLLDNMDGRELPGLHSARIRVFAARFPEPWPFECIVVVPPRIAKRFEHQSGRLERVTYWVVPSFAWEFRDGEDGEGFWSQIERRDGWNVSVIRWDRRRKTRPGFDR